MKRLHRADLYGWTVFDTARNLDFHSLLWLSPSGNVAIDPLPMSTHDQAHLQALGGVDLIIITNSDHLRDAPGLAQRTGARILAPAAESDTLSAPIAEFLTQGQEPVAGLYVHTLDGSKTPGELALVLEDRTLITGDLIRCHEGGSLCMLPDPKLHDRATAIASVRRLAALPHIETVLPGDGWPLFRGGGDALRELAASLG